MNFGLQTASNWSAIFYPRYVNSAFYVIARLQTDQQMELNQTLPNGGW